MLDQSSDITSEAGTLDMYSNPSPGTSSVKKGGKKLVQTKLPALSSSSLGESEIFDEGKDEEERKRNQAVQCLFFRAPFLERPTMNIIEVGRQLTTRPGTLCTTRSTSVSSHDAQHHHQEEEVHEGGSINHKVPVKKTNEHERQGPARPCNFPKNGYLIN